MPHRSFPPTQPSQRSRPAIPCFYCIRNFLRLLRRVSPRICNLLRLLRRIFRPPCIFPRRTFRVSFSRANAHTQPPPRPVLHQTTRHTPHAARLTWSLPRIAPPTVQDAARSCVESRSGYLPLTLRKSASRVPAACSTRFAPFPSCRITSRAGTVQELPRTATPNRNLCESTLPPFRVALLDTVSLYFYPHSQLSAPASPCFSAPHIPCKFLPRRRCVKNPCRV